MKKFKFTISGNQYEVEVQSFENDKAQVVVNGTQYEVDVEREKEEAKPVIAPRPAAPKAAAPAAAPAAGGNVDGVKADVLAEEVVFGSTDGFVKEWSINGEDVTLGVKKA